MSENQVMAQAVKTFHGEEGPKNPASAPFAVSRARFADLAANGLVIEATDNESESADVTRADSSLAAAAVVPEEESVTPEEPKSGRGSRAK